MSRPLKTGRALRSSSDNVARGKRFVVIASDFHRTLSESLVRGATQALKRHGATTRNIRILWVPGAFELPVVAARLAESKPRPHAVIALGTLIRGQTAQYRVLAEAVAQGLAHVGVTSKIPVTFGVVVSKTIKQARERAGGSMGNRGEEAALAALGVLSLFDRLSIR